MAGASYDFDFDHQFIETEKYDAKMTYKKIVKFYNLRDGKERIFDDMNNGFGWARLYQLNIYTHYKSYQNPFALTDG